MGSDIQNTNLQCDSCEVKGCNQQGHLCTARLDGLNRVTLQHNKGIRWTIYQCLLDAILELTLYVTADSGKPTGLPAHAYSSYTAPGMYHTAILWYGVGNPGKVGSITVYPPF